MSRIYEALRRAEAEGTVPWGEQQLLEQPGGAKGSITGPSLAELEAELLTAGPVFMGKREPSPRTPATVDVRGIVRRAWNPCLPNLPALQNQGAAVEQFRSLRSRLFDFRNQHPLKAILISSGLPREGKSFVAANLAISLARHENSRVLLIDGDMRHCTLHTLLGCESQPCLTDYLSGKAGALEVMQEADPTHNLEKLPQYVLMNLAFIAGGNSGEEAADLSGNPRFQELIATVAPNFEWIIVDSSPVIPASDAVNLARACDGVLLVARAGVTRFQVAQRAQGELKASNILGFVLNGAAAAPTTSHYYGSASPELRTERRVS